MEIKNCLKKGTILSITVENGHIYLIGESKNLDITSKLSEHDKLDVLHLGKALAIAKNEEEIELIKYVQYHTHSHYSILDGMSNLSDLAKKSSGVAAITDHGNMYGFLKWQKAMSKENKKPLFGSEVYVETINKEKEGHHLILLAKNEIGRKNLYLLSSNAFHNIYKKPHVSLDDLSLYHDGLICTSACMGGELASTIGTNYEKAKEIALYYKQLFKDDYYIEIQKHHIKDEEKINNLLIQLAKELGIKIVAANDSHYLNPEDEKAHEILLCINTGATLSREHFSFDGNGYHFKTDTEMVQDFWDIPEAITNTFEIANKCILTIETGVYHFPNFPIPETFKNEHEYLIHLIDQGFEERYQGTAMYTDIRYKERLEYEKNIILSMGFTGYFLIVWDYVNYAKSNNIMVGPGRGSAAGSLVCYCLHITDVDPIQYNLLFERFLNPERMSMPDIDLDFEFERRQEVIDYVKSKYGTENVCNIITFGTMAAKTAIRDVARTMDNYSLGVSLAKMVPDDVTKGIQTAVDKNPELQMVYNSDKETKKVLDVAMQLEGSPRQTSVHACGVVVADAPVKNYLPTALVKDTKESKDSNSKILVSQVTMTEVEELGLLKMDFLGLRTMSVIGHSLEEINKQRTASNLKPFSYYREIPVNDPYVYKEISEGKTYAVFQIESEGMRSFMSDLFADVSTKIADIESHYQLSGFGDSVSGKGHDIKGYMNCMELFGNELFERMIAGISLYRPGPMDYIPDYIKGINDPSSIVYDVPQLEPILKPTYGVIVYQEQVMQIVQELAGFSMGAADTVRKAMGKKKQDILDEYRPYFLTGSGDVIDEHTGKKLNIAGCVNLNIPLNTAENIWQKMSEFAKYAFNKSHAAVYAVLTVTSAWIKHYYPTIYMCSMLNAYIDSDKLKGYINVAKFMSLDILPPSVNMSEEKFSLENNSIRFGLQGIKGLSKNVKEIINERSANPFSSMQDFIERTIPFLKQNSYKSLILSGAFDEFASSRAAKVEILDTMISVAKDKLKDQVSGQLTLFEPEFIGEEMISIPNIPEFPNQTKLAYEKEFAGLYISEHPLDEYSQIVSQLNSTSISLLDNDETITCNEKTTVVGLITDIVTHYTKKDKKPMSVFKVEDSSGELKCVLFPKEYETLSPFLKKGTIVVLKGELLHDDNFGTQLSVNSILDIKKCVNTQIKHVYIRLSSLSQISQLENMLLPYAGSVPVSVQIDKQLYAIKTSVIANSTLYMNLQNQYGSANVMYK